MSSASWQDVDADLDSMAEHFRNAAAIHERGAFDDEGLDGYIASMAFLHSMQCGYASAEAALLRILDAIEEDRPTGADWHQVLIRRWSMPIPEGEFARPALLGRRLADAMQELRGFRHMAIHIYERIYPERFPAAVAAASRVVTELPEAVRNFRDAIDPMDR
jgi:hypothetical protein